MEPVQAPSPSLESSPPVLVRIDGAVATVTLNRPRRKNALHAGTWSLLLDTFRALQADPAVRAVVLTGAEGNFSSGDDIVEYAKVRDLPGEAAAYGERIVQVYAAIKSAGFPVIAAIDGVCVGAGCSVAMACDFRIASPTARVGIPAVKLGILYSAALCRRLVGLVGLSHARRWLMEGELQSGAQALADGFVDAVADDALAAALARAQKLAAAAPLAIAGTKLILDSIHDDRVEERMADIAAAFARAGDSEDAREAAAAFRDKRPAVFRGR